MKLGPLLPPLFPDVLAASMDVASISCHLLEPFCLNVRSSFFLFCSNVTSLPYFSPLASFLPLHTPLLSRRYTIPSERSDRKLTTSMHFIAKLRHPHVRLAFSSDYNRPQASLSLHRRYRFCVARSYR